MRVRDPFPLEGAACAGTDNPDIFTEREDHKIARLFCEECPVRAPCYLTAIANRYTGTWGGVWIDPKVGRRKMRADRIRNITIEARHYLAEKYGIVVQHSHTIEKDLHQVVRRLLKI